jgi:lysophospholipase L1-like esterase
MGASLVYGLKSTNDTGFRLSLLNRLQASGTSVSYIGTQSSGTMSQNHHEAYLAVTIDKLADQIASNGAFELHPHVVLLLVGVNDCWYMADEVHDEDPGVDPRVTDGKYTAQRLGTLLSTLHTHFPNSLVLASELPLNTNEWQDKCIRGFNQYLPAAVGNATASGQMARYVSMYDAVPESMIQEDGTHPTDKGYGLMAERWFDAVQDAVGEVCGGMEAKKDGMNETGTTSMSTTGGGQATTTTTATRPSLTLDGGVGTVATEGVAVWAALPLAVWALVG